MHHPTGNAVAAYTSEAAANKNIQKIQHEI
jgi:hypothetical protein